MTPTAEPAFMNQTSEDRNLKARKEVKEKPAEGRTGAVPALMTPPANLDS